MHLYVHCVIPWSIRPLRKWITKRQSKASDGASEKTRGGFKPQQLFPDAEGRQKGAAGGKGRNAALSPTARGKSKQTVSPKPNKKKAYQLLVSCQYFSGLR